MACAGCARKDQRIIRRLAYVPAFMCPRGLRLGRNAHQWTKPPRLLDFVGSPGLHESHYTGALPSMPVIKDLVVDLADFYKKYELVKPYLITKTNPPETERLQSNEDAEKLFESAKCILCACCSTSCPSLWTNENYLGPASLLKAYRFTFDTRDEAATSGSTSSILRMEFGDATQFLIASRPARRRSISPGIFHN